MADRCEGCHPSKPDHSEPVSDHDLERLQTHVEYLYRIGRHSLADPLHRLVQQENTRRG